MLQVLLKDSSLLVLTAIFLTALSGVPGLFIRQGNTGQRLATVLAATAFLLALPAIIIMLLTRQTATFVISWNLPFDSCEIALDPLALFFLIPIFLVFSCGSLYANGYWPAASHRTTEPGVTFFYGLLAAAMAMVVLSRNGLLFLIAWELMALSGYFLLITEHEEPEVRSAGTVYLIASHIGVAALFVLFSQMKLHTATFLFPVTAGLHLEPATAAILFIAAFIGFGSKAGLMPLHIWLPSAHANAPSHVSALLSGVMLKMGIYGLLRVISFMPERPLWWGGLLTVTGLISALLGICLATSQRDIKRLLAYSSIENLGIITAAIGVALVGYSTGNLHLAFLGMTAGLFHLLNHSIFKPLLFFSAGSVIHASGSRELDQMGGLAKNMPWTASLALCGAVAICGLPPFNGFVSEFFLYLSFFGEARGAAPYIALGAPVLAMVGGVAIICFVKLYGIAFLGSPRAKHAASCHEAPRSMLIPMAALALLCLLGGVFPQGFMPLVTPAVATLIPATAGANLPIKLHWLTFAGAGVLVLFSVIALVIMRRNPALPAATAPTWGCGYLRPTPRMQYTGTAFSAMFTTLTNGFVRTRVRMNDIAGNTPATAEHSYQPEETILERLILPLFQYTGICFSFIRRLQHGHMQVYMFYIFVTLLLLMLWVH
jgi:hydrogenase-4 component B